MLKAEVIGNLGSDAEIKTFSGNQYVTFNVAHSEKKRGQNGQEYTIWVSVYWYGNGGGLFQYLKKGSRVYVSGRLSVKTFQDRNGQTQVSVNINANEVELLNSAKQPVQQTQQQNNQSGDMPF